MIISLGDGEDARWYKIPLVQKDWASSLPLQHRRSVRHRFPPDRAELVWHSNQRYQGIPHKKEKDT